MSTSTYIEWCNENAGRSYPLATSASQLDNHGRKLPVDVIVDLGLMLPPEYADVYCTSVRLTPNLIGVSFACADAPLLVGLVQRSLYTPYTALPLTPLTENVAGWIVYGQAKATTAGLYAFEGPEQSGIAPRAVRVMDRLPVWRMLRHGGSPDVYLDGLVRLVPGGDLDIYQDETDPKKIIIAVKAERAARYLGPCNSYGDSDGCLYTSVRSINGVPPDANGHITIRFAP